jgi:hypothetical protein
MARVGGRNTVFAWTVGLACAAVVAALVWLAAPLVPAGLLFVGEKIDPPTSGPVAGSGDDAGEGDPRECRDLYPDTLWSALVWADDSVLSPSEERPTSSAQGFVDALAPQVRFTCEWVSTKGRITTTLAAVPADAAAIAKTALPALGFTCDPAGDRLRCVLKSDERIETIETGGGVWLSTTEDGWHPSRYVEEMAERVWASD